MDTATEAPATKLWGDPHQARIHGEDGSSVTHGHLAVKEDGSVIFVRDSPSVASDDKTED